MGKAIKPWQDFDGDELRRLARQSIDGIKRVGSGNWLQSAMAGDGRMAKPRRRDLADCARLGSALQRRGPGGSEEPLAVAPQKLKPSTSDFSPSWSSATNPGDPTVLSSGVAAIWLRNFMRNLASR